MSESILSRVTASASDSTILTPLQAKVEAGVSSSQNQLFDPYNIASWLIGAAAYGLVRRTGIRIGEEMAIRGSSFYSEGILLGLRQQDSFLVTQMTGFYNRPFTTWPSVLSVPVAIGAASGSQVLSRRVLSNWAGREASNPNLWKWKGEGGIRDEFYRSLFNYGAGLAGAEAALRGNAAILGSDLSLPGKLGFSVLLTSALAGGYYGLGEIGGSHPSDEPKQE